MNISFMNYVFKIQKYINNKETKLNTSCYMEIQHRLFFTLYWISHTVFWNEKFSSKNISFSFDLIKKGRNSRVFEEIVKRREHWNISWKDRKSNKGICSEQCLNKSDCIGVRPKIHFRDSPKNLFRPLFGFW